MWIRRLLVVVAVVAGGPGCGDDGAHADAVTPPPIDAAIDATVVDAPVDAPVDAMVDARLPAVLRINELNPKLVGDCDLIELRVLAGGTMDGAILRDRTSTLLTFAGLIVATNDLVLVHLDGGDVACNPGTSGNETTGPAQHPALGFAANVDTAYDWYSPIAGLDTISGVIAVAGAQGLLQDVVCFHDSSDGPIPNATLTSADVVAAAGQWPADPQGTYDAGDYRLRGADVFELELVRAGKSLQRNGNFDNNVAPGDWTPTATGTYGTLNSGQTPF